MKRVFVDCDDTLIIYKDGGTVHPYGVDYGEYYINESLAESIKNFVYDNPCALVVIWSGGGADYARRIADIVLPGVDGVTCMIKDRTTFYLVHSGDIVIDDMADSVEGLPVKVLKPDEWHYTRKASA
jgi:hypothetical protein